MDLHLSSPLAPAHVGFPSSFYLSNLWHRQLGHPSKIVSVLWFIVVLICVIVSRPSSFVGCKLAKQFIKPFPYHTYICHVSNVEYSNVLGPAPIPLLIENKYDTSFIDEHLCLVQATINIVIAISIGGCWGERF